MTRQQARPAMSLLFLWRTAVACPASPLSATTRHVALTLSLHMNNEGRNARPSIALLREETSLADSTIRAALLTLEREGFIARAVGHGPGRATRYVALLDENRRLSAVERWQYRRESAVSAPLSTAKPPTDGANTAASRRLGRTKDVKAAAARTHARTRESGGSSGEQDDLVTAGADPDARVTADRTAADEDERALADPHVSAVLDVLRSIPKRGYAEGKLRPARLAALLAQFPGTEHEREARSLVEWETDGVGAEEDTRDGVARFRAWLGRVDTSAGNGRSGSASPYRPMPDGERV